MIAKKVIRSESANKVISYDNDNDVPCWNCTKRTISEKHLEPITLVKVRQQHRANFKLYSFLTSELFKPKVVPLKQKISGPLSITKIIDETLAEDAEACNSKESYESNLKILPMNTDVYVCQNSTEIFDDLTPELYTQKQLLNIMKTRERIIEEEKDTNPNNKAEKFNKISPSDEDKMFEDVLHKLEIETHSKIKRDVQEIKTKVSYSANDETAHKQINQVYFEEFKDDCDKIDNVSSNVSDFGNVVSCVRDISEQLDSNKTMSDSENTQIHNLENTCSEPSNVRNLNNCKEFERSMPVLYASSQEANETFTKSMNSLYAESSFNKKVKMMRWSSFSFCKKPYDNDDEVFSEIVSPGHAGHTLPRRSNSPLPHDRDPDRDRFPINRSGLQGRSESMASVYSGAGEGLRGNLAVKGEVQFSLLYNYRLGALEVGVKRCRDLAAVDVKRNRSDPYVKVYLLPDKSKTGKRKTKVKKNTLNPVFEETLNFVQPLASLSSRTLWLSVWHADMFGRNDFLGEVTLPLADVVFDDPAPTWHKLHERTEQFDEHQGTRGDLIVGLKFELQESNSMRGKGTLHVLVKEAKNLVATKPNGLADVFCKSYLLPERGRLAKQKTSVSRRTLNPHWEHTFTYRGLTMQELGTRALELSLWDRDRLASNEFMGAIRLSLGTGTYMGASVNWMDSVGKELTLWQTMMQRPNFWVEGSLPLRPQLNN